MLSGNSLRQTVHTHRASVHQAVKLVAAILRVAGVTGGKQWQPTAGFMTHVTCRLTAKNLDQLRNPMLSNRVYGLLLLSTALAGEVLRSVVSVCFYSISEHYYYTTPARLTASFPGQPGQAGTGNRSNLQLRAHLSEELLDELFSPAEVKAPRLGRVTDVGRVHDQSQRLRLINAAETHSMPTVIVCTRGELKKRDLKTPERKTRERVGYGETIKP